MPSSVPKPVSKLVLLGEAWGQQEERIRSAFVGASGVELLKMLDEAGVITLTSADHSYISAFWRTSKPQNINAVWQLHPEVSRMNVFNFHPAGNKIETLCGPKELAIHGYPKLSSKGPGWLHRRFQSELDRLGDDILRANPNLIVCLGNTPLWALAGTTGISKLRGTTRISTHTVSGYKLLPTYHPAAVLRQWELRPTVVVDLIKASREMEYPEVRRPEREIWIEPTLGDLGAFYERYIASCTRLAVDIETSGNQITCIGLSPNPRIGLVIPFYDSRGKNRSFWPDLQSELHAWDFVRKILEDRSIHKIFQNGLYDIAFIWRSTGIKTYGAEEDTMLLHHSLQPEALKGLGYLGSVYTDEGAWKQERRVSTTIKRDK